MPLRAAIGTSSAFCMPAFGQLLGAASVGVFAADKPDDAISQAALSQAGSPERLLSALLTLAGAESVREVRVRGRVVHT